MEKKVYIGLVGLGTVGRGVYDGLAKNGELIAQRTGVKLEVKGVCDKDSKALAAIPSVNGMLKTSSAEGLSNDPGIDIIVELIGGVNPAKDIILSAIKKKKHIVTANKALLSEHWKEIFRAASENSVFVNFEGAVGGGIPVIRAMRSGFVADNIKNIYGILNGTTNFILTMMEEKLCTFKDALTIAQEKGIAEKDPTLDVSGKDSAHKLAILALLGFGIDISPDDIYTEGIENISPEDIQNARKWGYGIKLLAIAKDDSKNLQLRVHPTLIRSSHLLCDVKWDDNAILIKGDLVGDSLLFGKGAGREPTSSSVIADLVEIAKHVAFVGKTNPFPYNMNYAPVKREISRIEELQIPYYLRFSVIDKPGVLASISTILSDNGISIANVSQEERNEGEIVPVVILTHLSRGGSMTKAIAQIDRLDYIKARTVVIRMEA